MTQHNFSPRKLSRMATSPNLSRWLSIELVRDQKGPQILRFWVRKLGPFFEFYLRSCWNVVKYYTVSLDLYSLKFLSAAAAMLLHLCCDAAASRWCVWCALSYMSMYCCKRGQTRERERVHTFLLGKTAPHPVAAEVKENRMAPGLRSKRLEDSTVQNRRQRGREKKWYSRHRLSLISLCNR